MTRLRTFIQGFLAVALITAGVWAPLLVGGTP
jgi:hypothetical protein